MSDAARLIGALEQKCKWCMVINKGSDCPFYADCQREVRTGMTV